MMPVAQSTLYYNILIFYLQVDGRSSLSERTGGGGRGRCRLSGLSHWKGNIMRLQFFFDSDSIEELSLQLEAKVGLESLRGKRVVVVVTGSNVSPNELVELTN